MEKRFCREIVAVFFIVILTCMLPDSGLACGCGCSLFDVRTGSMLPPTGGGGVAFLEYNFVNQDRNWSGSSGAPSADNSDKQIRTEFYTFGAQYMFNQQWGAIVEVPYENRIFKTDVGGGSIARVRHEGVGDIRIKGIYSGFSPDMSSGITFGLKLPTGDHDNPGFDRDTQIGTGSTDILLGGFLRGTVPGIKRWDWFLTGQLDQPTLTAGEYRPGADLNGVAGIYYRGWNLGGVKVTPVAQAIGSHHWRDCGTDANFADSGYDRILLSPGVEFHMGDVSLYTDVALPVYQNVNGNQLTAQELVTLRISYSF